MMQFAMQDLWWIVALFAAMFALLAVYLKITMQFSCYLRYELNHYLQVPFEVKGAL